jgi:hypothetical protein
MPNALITRIDRRLANAIIARGRRRWPLLRLVPASVIRPLVTPAATTIRRDLSRIILIRVIPIGVLIALVLWFKRGA